MSSNKPSLPLSQSEWRDALDALPSSKATGRIPAFFFAHGSPMLLIQPREPMPSRMNSIQELMGPQSPLARFLHDFGPLLLSKYNPDGIVVFGAHWETDGEILVTDYEDENPLLMDYYGFDHDLYQVRFKSRSSSALSNRVLDALKEAGIKARKTKKNEPRGQDGRGFPGPGLDHGVFVPFKLMFGDDFPSVPIVQVSIDGSLDPNDNWKLGKALQDLRSSNILILSGGLTVHNLRDPSCWNEKTAKPSVVEFHETIFPAVLQTDVTKRLLSMSHIMQHPGFRAAHPRPEHFVPIYIAAGAGEIGGVLVINAAFGAPTFAFGI